MTDNVRLGDDGPASAGLSVGQDTAKVAGLIVVGAVVFLAGLRLAFRSNLGG